MAQQGARIVIADIDAQAGEQARTKIGAAGGEAHFIRTDVTSMSDMEAVAKAAVDLFGSIDILVNNAAQAIGGVVDEIDEATWNRVMTTNLTSVWRGMKVCVPEMRKRKKGAIVNVSSVQALAGFKGWAAYAAAKGGVNALTQQAAVDLAPYGIRVNAVIAGGVEAPGRQSAKFRAAYGRKTMLRRMARAEEIASAVAFLAGGDASYITGAALAVDGGYTAW